MRDPDSNGPKYVRVGCSETSGALSSVREAMDGIDLSVTCFILAFIPERLNLDEMMAALERYGGGVPVFGCSSAGQITPEGYDSEALMLMAFPKRNFRCASVLLSPLRPFSGADVMLQVQRANTRFQHTVGWNRLGLIFTDGVSKQEDILVSTLDAALEDVPVFGGSAGDALRFERTWVLHNGQAYKDAAVLVLIETNLQFQGVGFDHFLPEGAPLVITRADPEERLVYDINGAPAAKEYARLVGCDVEDLSPQVFAENPLLLELNQNHYVRAIGQVEGDQALSLLAAIDEGLIMTLGRGQEIIRTLETGLELKDASGVPPDFILGFDCVLRKLEIEQRQLQREANDVLRARRVLGFNTFGEQQSGLHMNQTFVGVAFFEPDRRNLF